MHCCNAQNASISKTLCSQRADNDLIDGIDQTTKSICLTILAHAPTVAPTLARDNGRRHCHAVEVRKREEQQTRLAEG
jgi:hypothetical protein